MPTPAAQAGRAETPRPHTPVKDLVEVTNHVCSLNAKVASDGRGTRIGYSRTHPFASFAVDAAEISDVAAATRHLYTSLRGACAPPLRLCR